MPGFKMLYSVYISLSDNKLHKIKRLFFRSLGKMIKVVHILYNGFHFLVLLFS